jgi:hypothetical protein
MTISYWLNLSTLYGANWRNIFHFSSGQGDTGISGERVAASWVYPGGTELSLVDDLENLPNQWDLSVQNIQLNVPTFVSIVWNGRDVTSYVNGTLQTTITYPYDILQATSSTILYIGDPWYPVDGGVKICNFQIFNSSLYQTQINKIYNSQINSLPPVPPYVPPDTPIKCGEYNFCVNLKNDIPYCYGSSSGCLWNTNDCKEDSDCSKYNSSTSLQYKVGPSTCPYGDDSWADNTCKLFNT